MQPLKLEELYPIFCEELAQQEFDSTNRYIDIPEEIVEYYKTFRPSPLIRAYNLEKELGTPAKIYCKFEGNNTSGSHKLNSAIAQAYYAKSRASRPHYGDGGRPVGHGALHGVRIFPHSVDRLYGQNEL